MTDSHALPRATAKARERAARKPPKRPWFKPQFPWWFGLFLLVRYGGMYGFSATAQQIWPAVAAGFICLVFALELWIAWQWRQWFRYSGEKLPKETRGQRLFLVACIAAGVGVDLFRYATTGVTPWEAWVNAEP